MKTTLFEPQLLCGHIWLSMASQTFFFLTIMSQLLLLRYIKVGDFQIFYFLS